MGGLEETNLSSKLRVENLPEMLPSPFIATQEERCGDQLLKSKRRSAGAEDPNAASVVTDRRLAFPLKVCHQGSQARRGLHVLTFPLIAMPQ